ncbi:TPA: hypothetical protein HA318_03545 [Candidatus Micrarchaeota archaeon]|nr:hypothetical protein [Candidatus Micrarchaeota archaeon]
MNKVFLIALVLAVALCNVNAQPYCSPENPSCCRYLEYAIEPVSTTVVRGATADYAIVLTNTAIYSQVLRASAQCAELSCEFSDLSFPTTLMPGQSTAFHLLVHTADAETIPRFIPLEIRGGTLELPCTENANMEGNALGVSLNVVPPIAPESTPITATISPSVQQTILQEETAEYVITLHNGFAEKTYATISSSGNAFAETTFLSASQVELAANETKNVSIRVIAPPGTPGETYYWTFLVRSSAGDQLSFPVALQVYAPRAAVSLLGGPYPYDCVATRGGERKTIEMALRNDGEATSSFLVSLEATSSVHSIASLDKQLIELKQGEQTPLTLSITPSRATVLDDYSATLVVKRGQFEMLRRNICFSVKGLKSIEVLKPASSTILRGRTNTIPFKLRNIGTLSEEIAFEWDPLQEAGEILVQPSKLTLSPSESADAQLIVTVPMGTQLNDFVIPIRLHVAKSNYTLAANFNVSVYSSNASNESLLSISPLYYTAVQDGMKIVHVVVSNNGDGRMEQTRLVIEEIPASWYSVDFPRPIGARGRAQFTLTLVPPTGSTGKRPIKLFVWSGRESLKQDAELEVKPFLDELEVRETARAEKVSKTQVSELELTLHVTNTGDDLIENISPVLLADDVLSYNYDVLPNRISLAAGQSADLKMTLRPNRQTEARALPIQLASDEGKTEPTYLQVPSMTAAVVASPQPPWKVITIIALLVIIFAVYAYEKRGK